MSDSVHYTNKGHRTIGLRFSDKLFDLTFECNTQIDTLTAAADGDGLVTGVVSDDNIRKLIRSNDLDTIQFDINDNDSDPTNEIELPTGGSNGQVLSTDGSGVYSWVDDSTGGGGTDDQDIESMALSGTTLTVGIENGASDSVDLAALQDGTVTAGGVQSNAYNGDNRLVTLLRSNSLPAIQYTFTDNTGWLTANATGGIEYFYPNATNALNARVGIGNLAPSHPLDVNGDVRFRDKFFDGLGNEGTDGQVLSSTGDEIEWIDATTETAQLNNPSTATLSTSTSTWSTVKWGSSGSSTNITASSTTESFTNNSGGLIQVNLQSMLNFSGDVGSSIDVGIFINNSTNPFREYRFYLNSATHNSYALNGLISLSDGQDLNIKTRQTSSNTSEQVDTVDEDSTMYVIRAK